MWAARTGRSRARSCWASSRPTPEARCGWTPRSSRTPAGSPAISSPTGPRATASPASSSATTPSRRRLDPLPPHPALSPDGGEGFERGISESLSPLGRGQGEGHSPKEESHVSIQRLQPGKRLSAAVVHGDTVYLAGQIAGDASADVKGQTQQILKKIDDLLAAAGTSKSKLLSATIWLADMRYFDDMNSVWDAWMDPANPPARATVEARLAAPKYFVEIAGVAAK